MFQTVELPLWIVVLGAIALASLTLNAVLLPSVRWFFRGRVNKLLNRANERLRLSLKPFALTKRQVLVDRLTYDPVVIEAVADEARDTGVPREVVAERANRYAKEIVPSFSAAAYFLFGVRLSRWITQMLYRVRLGASEDRALEGIDPEATVVFVMNHRSNVDYLLVTYLASERTSLSYAAGEWARVWPLEQIAKAMGAFFIRRKSENPLYRKVLARYVQMATEGGVTQAIFPEGGLSRDGSLRPPKLGLLSYMLETFDPDGPRDVVFVPVGLNYDRVLEDRILVGHETDEQGRPRFRASVWVGLGFFVKHAWLRLTRRGNRFGYASVSFGAPLSLREMSATGRTPKALGKVLIKSVGKVVPVLPVPLIATVMMDRQEALSRERITQLAVILRDELLANGAHFHVPRSDFDYTVEVGLRALVRRRILKCEGDDYAINPAQSEMLAYYRNSIAHLRSVQIDTSPASSGD